MWRESREIPMIAVVPNRTQLAVDHGPRIVDREQCKVRGVVRWDKQGKVWRWRARKGSRPRKAPGIPKKNIRN